jgi:hypothetical protein
MKSIQELCVLSMNARFNAPAKDTFLKAAHAALSELAEDLGLEKPDYSIRTNRAGTAVAGDVTLHHERIYVTLGEYTAQMLGLARSCKGRRDFSGGQNRPILDHHDWHHVRRVSREILKAAA